MKHKILGLLAVGLLAGPMAANASIIVNFTGTCNVVGCPTRADSATSVLTLYGGYVFGSALDASDFASFAYSSEDLPYSIGADDLFAFVGILNADGTLGPGDFVVQSLNNNLFIDGRNFHSASRHQRRNNFQPNC